MSGRTYVVIFFFWAVLTIVTPTLILLSESSKPDLDNNVDIKNMSEEPRARRMMVYSNKPQKIKEEAFSVVSAPAPGPLPEPVSGNGIEEVISTRKNANHNRSYGKITEKSLQHESLVAI